MKKLLYLVSISLSLVLSGCELFIIGALEKSTRDKMYDYMQAKDGWQITSVTQYEAERTYPDSSFNVVLDTTWDPMSSIYFFEGKENDTFLYKPLTYVDANGDSTIAEYDLYPDGDNPAFDFYHWPDYPFPHRPGNIYLLEVWSDGTLVIASRIESVWRQYDVVIRMEEK